MASITLISATLDYSFSPVAVGVTFSTSGVSDGQTVNFRFFFQGVGNVNNYSGTYNGGAAKTVYFILSGVPDTSHLTVDVVASTNNFSTYSNYVTATNETTPSFPTTTWDNGYTPRLKDQYVQEWNGSGYTHSNTTQAGNCIPQALTSMLETFYYKKYGVSGVRYSVSWIFGNRSSSDIESNGGMMMDEALSQLQADGTPLFNELSDLPYPDNMMYFNWDAGGYTNTGAKNRVASKYSDIITNARKSRIASWTKYSPALSNFSSLISALQSNGVILVQLREAYNFWTGDLGANFEVKKPDDFSVPNDNHDVIIRGWKQISGQYYWICHNNWGSWFGNGQGYFLLPINYTGIENYWTATENITTLTLPVPNTPTDAPILDTAMDGDGRSGDTLYVKFNGVSGADSYSVKIRRGYDNATTYVTSSFTSGIYCGHLQYGVTYYISYAGVNSAGTGVYSTENAATTLPQPPTISGTTTQSTISITASIASPVGNFTEIQVERYDASSNYIDTKFISFDDFNAGNKTVTWSGLGATTTYKFKARTMFTVSSVNLYSNYSSTSTLTTSSRPANFSWTTSKVSGQDFNLTATEWNSFTSRINQFLTYKGQPTISFTTAPYTSSDRTFYYWMYNQAANAFINTLNTYTSTPYTHGTASSGGIIYAYFLNDMVSALNNIS
jgi:hypothetical protein